MGKRLGWALAVAVVGVLAAGCASVHVATKFNDQKITADVTTPVAHVNAKNWGIYLVGIIPLITGDPARSNAMLLLEDTVNLDTVVGMATAKSKDLGGTRTTDLVSSRTNVWIVPTLLFFYRSVGVSGNASK